MESQNNKTTTTAESYRASIQANKTSYAQLKYFLQAV